MPSLEGRFTFREVLRQDRRESPVKDLVELRERFCSGLSDSNERVVEIIDVADDRQKAPIL